RTTAHGHARPTFELSFEHGSPCIPLAGHFYIRSDTRSETDLSSHARDRFAGFVVSSTQHKPVSASAHATVPVAPYCPKVRGEHPRPNSPASSRQPSPHVSFSPVVWLVVIIRAVSRFSTRPFGRKNACRNFAMSPAVACTPPHGAPRSRQYGVFQFQSSLVSTWHCAVSTMRRPPRPSEVARIPSGRKTSRRRKSRHHHRVMRCAISADSRLPML